MYHCKECGGTDLPPLIVLVSVDRWEYSKKGYIPILKENNNCFCFKCQDHTGIEWREEKENVSLSSNA